MPDLWFRAEYLVEFTDTVDQIFSSEDIAAALSDDTVMPLFLEAVDTVRYWAPYNHRVGQVVTSGSPGA